MRNCSMCKINSQCERRWKGIDDPTSCVSFTPIKTNYDNIMHMSIEELAEEIYLLRLDAIRIEGFEGFIETKEEVLDWLKEEAWIT